MIFSAVNEKGENLFDLVLAGKKTVTRRKHPVRVGAVLSVQRGRGKKGEAKIKVLSCELDEDWNEKEVVGLNVLQMENLISIKKFRAEIEKTTECEARREGFVEWAGLWNWIHEHYGDKLPEFYRIEFKLMKKEAQKLED